MVLKTSYWSSETKLVWIGLQLKVNGWTIFSHNDVFCGQCWALAFLVYLEQCYIFRWMFVWFFKDKIILLVERPCRSPSYQMAPLPKFDSLPLLRWATKKQQCCTLKLCNITTLKSNQEAVDGVRTFSKSMGAKTFHVMGTSFINMVVESLFTKHPSRSIINTRSQCHYTKVVSWITRYKKTP